MSLHEYMHGLFEFCVLAFINNLHGLVCIIKNDPPWHTYSYTYAINSITISKRLPMTLKSFIPSDKSDKESMYTFRTFEV